MGIFDFKEFVFRSNKVLPTEYDDSLSYYEVLNKVANNLNVISRSMGSLADSLVSPYDDTKSYVPGDYVWNNGHLYKCTNANTGSWNINDWGGDVNGVVFADSVSEDMADYKSYVDNIIDNFSDMLTTAINNVANPYDPTHEYEVGDYVVYSAILYKCIADTTGTFDVDDWEQVVVIDEVFNYMTEMWAEFIADYAEHLGLADGEGESTTEAMTQKATTDSLKKRLALSYVDATVIPNTDYTTVDDVLTIGNYRINTAADATAALAPVPNPGRLFVFTLASTNHKFQVYIASVTSTGDRVYIRSKYSTDNWSSWVRLVTTDLIQNEAISESPSPISSGAVYNIKNEIDTAIGMALKLNTGSATIVPNEEYPTFDDITVPGNFRTTSAANATAAGAPVPNAGRLICLTTSGTSYLFQVYISNVSANFRVHMRSKYGSSDWRDWARVITTEIVDEYPTANSARVVSSGGTYQAIQEAVANSEIPKTIPVVQPSNNGKINIPGYIHNTSEIHYHYVGPDNVHRGTTQGIASDGKRYLFFPLRNLGGDSGDSEIPVMCKWDAAKNVPVLFNTTEPKSFGHIEDMCFVPYYAKGFDNGNVDRLYLTDLNRTDSNGKIHVLRADNLSFITTIDTYDENDDSKNLISTTLAPNWHGVHHVGYSSEREMFFVHCGRSVGTNRAQIIGVFDKDGHLIRGLNFDRDKGTLYGCDCDENYIYLSIYLATEVTDVYDIYLSVFDWELNPITTVQIEQSSWEVEGVCHIGNDFYISWIESGGSTARDIFISKSRYIKYNQFSTSQVFPVDWLNDVFDTTDFSPFVPTP